ncbi:hypothetical protein [Mesorhizobium sp.]|uniref:deazapurine DNA modification protein DpdA family protein n=1 Tax=Mesorhizobium sp. TaxID=1871066 RepID=UPI000FE89C80|nr:hypothetical protein [Mesorhizobium sp.]RWG00014.1 MAG: hypothetical protein EOQ54_27810 [Mesorhizobium sp.]
MVAPLFFIGLHQPSDGKRFQRACISWRRLAKRKRAVGCGEVIIDSGAFTELARHGAYRHGVGEYAAELHRLHTQSVVRIVIAVAQDYMCEPFMLAKTGLTIEDHQRLTVERYDALLVELNRLFGGESPLAVMPVLQGYARADYLRHIDMYGARLKPEMWVGVGSVCKRNGDPARIVEVLAAIKAARPDLNLHGFGIKLTALGHPGVRELLFSADSMAWSDAARKQGRNGNCWTEAARYSDAVGRVIALPPVPWQMPLPLSEPA